MKRPARALVLIPGLEGVGRRIHAAISDYLATRPGSIDVVHDLVSGKTKGDLPSNDVAMIRELLAGVVGATDVEPTDDDTCETLVRAGLLGAWRAAAEDPDDQPKQWLYSGAPVGIRHLPIHRSIFPPVEDEADDP